MSILSTGKYSTVSDLLRYGQSSVLRMIRILLTAIEHLHASTVDLANINDMTKSKGHRQIHRSGNYFHKYENFLVQKLL